MKVIILAAGQGSRLGNYTKVLPKALVDINGKSLIQRQIDLLRKNDIKKIIVITGFNPEKFNLENVSYIEDVNYVPVNPDWSDLMDKIEYILGNYEKYSEYSQNFREEFKRVYSLDNICMYWYKIFKNLHSVEANV